MADLKREEKNEVIVIAGATGTGKTAYALKNYCNSNKYELLSGDSLQIYKYLDIGTAKGKVINNSNGSVSYTENPELHIWGINLLEPTEMFSVANFQTYARQKFTEIFARGKTPVVVGGTGYYLTALINNYSFVAQDNDLKVHLAKLTVTELQEQLRSKKFDLKLLNNSDLNNPRRLQNLLARIDSPNINTENPYNYSVKVLNVETETHRELLKQRVQEMLINCFVDEVESLWQKYGNNLASQIKTAPGYTEILKALIDGVDKQLINSKAMAATIFQSHWKLVKKQATWNKKYL